MHDVSKGYPSDPESYANGSVATGRASLVGQVKGEGSDEEVLQKRIPMAEVAEKQCFGTVPTAEEGPRVDQTGSS